LFFSWAGSGGDGRDRPVRHLVSALVFLAVAMLSSCASSAYAQSTNPAVVGQWSTVQNWPCRGIHMILLPTGKVMFWTRWGQADNQTHPFLWDPAVQGLAPIPTNPTFPGLPSAGWQEFCCGFSMIGDGRLLITGGDVSPDGVGSPHAAIY